MFILDLKLIDNAVELTVDNLKPQLGINFDEDIEINVFIFLVIFKYVYIICDFYGWNKINVTFQISDQ